MASSLPSRDFQYVREKVEAAIRTLPEQEACAVAVALVDDWAGQVMEAHISSEFFGLKSRTEFTVAHTTRWFGMLGAGPSGPSWAFDVDWVARDRVKFWVEHSSRFPMRLQIRPKPASSSAKLFP